jgi:hypothetical protein
MPKIKKSRNRRLSISGLTQPHPVLIGVNSALVSLAPILVRQVYQSDRAESIYDAGYRRQAARKRPNSFTMWQWDASDESAVSAIATSVNRNST